MKLVRQIDGSGTCGQCCVATLAGITLPEAIAVFGHGVRGGTLTREVVRALRQLGFVCESRLQPTDDGRPSMYQMPGRGKVALPVQPMHLLPPTAVVYLYYKKDKTLHWVLWHEGQFACPTDGINPRWLDDEVVVKSFLTIHKIPSPERIRLGVSVMQVESEPDAA